ncbi:MAG: histidine kinase [Gammaproteobacteria bacterium]|nr:histidine kinase [Gammaproteobacteria bacterium]
MKTPSPANGSIAAQWRHHVLHASRAYWITQVLLMAGYVAFSAVVLLGLTPVGDALPRHAGQVALRLLIEAALLFSIIHVLVRPPLQIHFVQRRVTLGKVVAGLALLLVLGYLNVGAGMLAGKLLTPLDGLSFDQIRFHAGDTAYDYNLGTGQLIAMGGFNQFSILLLWSVLYLAWKAFEGRRLLQQQVREARLRQLTHQLSPHFLFNAFNSIRGMIFEDRERAADLVTQLSELFRFHLGSEVRTEVELGEDWEIARRYLDIEAVRVEERLRLEVDLAPELRERKLPALTLLTLVENAIKHGIAPNRGGGRLSLRARPAGKGWWLEVENSVGRGEADYRGGNGLSNLREHLALTFGDDAALRVVRDNGRFLVRMEFPR